MGASVVAQAQSSRPRRIAWISEAPHPFVAPFHSFLLDRTPKAASQEPRAWRKDEYPG